MVKLGKIVIDPPLINTSCAWASDRDELLALYKSPHTGAVTTRTATLEGFVEDSSHTVAFATGSSINSYGYSPYPLVTYLSWVRDIIQADPSSSKPFIISITSSSPGMLSSMIDLIQALREELHDSAGAVSRIAVELNTSCPNIQGAPPLAYNFPAILPLLRTMANHYNRDQSLTLGIKLPPYFYAAQFEEVVRGLLEFSHVSSGGDDGTAAAINAFAFLTCTNTLGSSLIFAEQTGPSAPNEGGRVYALPTPLGGLAGEAIHALSLGNVYSFARLLAATAIEQEQQPEVDVQSPKASLWHIGIIGVGGVATAAAVDRMRRAGASVVGCATLLGRDGVGAFEKLSGNVEGNRPTSSSPLPAQDEFE